MTRLIVYSAGLVAFVAATAMTFSAIFLPNWISLNTTHKDTTIHYTYGLHRRCSSIASEPCVHFPQYEDCHHEDRYFCSMWRSVGFMMSFAAVLELVTIVAFTVVILGGRQKREVGWKVLTFLLFIVGVVQCASMAIVAYLYDNDERFFPGWKLDKSWLLCTVSWSVTILSAACIALSAYVIPSEGDYELIPSERGYTN